MIKKYKNTMIITSLITLLPVLAGIILWNDLPENIATHFGADNSPDGWSSKPFAVFGLPLVILAIHWFCMLATSLDPKSQNISSKAINTVLWLCPGLSLLLNTMIYAYAINNKLRIGFFVILFMGIVFIILGNYMPKCKQNYTFGIKISWTLNDEVNWNKTHRFAGKVWVAGGAVISATAVFENPVLFISVIVLMIALSYAYSFRIYKERKN